jgi:hypothetical protein
VSFENRVGPTRIQGLVNQNNVKLPAVFISRKTTACGCGFEPPPILAKKSKPGLRFVAGTLREVQI